MKSVDRPLLVGSDGSGDRVYRVENDLNKWVGGLTESGENHARSGEISPNPARSLPDLVRSLQIRRDLARLVRSRLAVLGEIQSALRCSVTSRRCVAVLGGEDLLGEVTDFVILGEVLGNEREDLLGEVTDFVILGEVLGNERESEAERE
uniref:Uncharacterized protein n=1 Tax=Fagus sylvatica TaxID=28930 RepID=A0A2N9F0D1_FAGSY